MSTGVILAGGRGSRLGPLAAQISKALVSVGQQPHVVHQLELFRRAEVDRVVVVTSPDTDVQVSSVLRRSGFPGHSVITVVQPRPLGPVDALRCALEVAPLAEPVLVLMSDTYLDELLPTDKDWVGVGPAPADRSFCWLDADRGVFVDSLVSHGEAVTVGAYCFQDAGELYALCCGNVRYGLESGMDEVGMAPLLTTYQRYHSLWLRDCETWQDLGDVQALALARRNKFVSRSHHRVELNADRLMTKAGSGSAFARQLLYLSRVDEDPEVSNLFPRFYGPTASGFRMEHVDLPTLSELWLYWPGRPDTWAGIVSDVLGQVRSLWGSRPSGDEYTPQEEFTLYAGRAMERVTQYDEANDTAWSLSVRELLRSARRHFTEPEPSVFPHGDLNWNNVLFSVNTGAVKLLDPRGDERLPLSYELAKMRYSYHGGFSAVTHKLFAPMDGHLLPQRDDESDAIDRVLADSFGADLDKLQAVEAMMLLAGSAMHPTDEAEIMLMRGTELLREVGQ